MLAWLVHLDDGQIDERELCEIQVLMTQLRCTAAVRQAVRSCFEEPQSLEAEEQIARMLELVPSEMADTTLALRCSLMKDAIRVWRATGEGSAREHPGIRRLAGMLELDEQKVAFIENACVQEERILAGEVSDSEITSAAKAMAAQAGGGRCAGCRRLPERKCDRPSAPPASSRDSRPLDWGACWACPPWSTASAWPSLPGEPRTRACAGFWAGPSGTGCLAREVMLQEVLRIHQGGIINLGEDMSFFGERVAALSRETDRNRDAIDKLSREVTLLSRSAGALILLGERASGFRARPAGGGGWPPHGKMKESSWREAERAALAQRVQLEALHGALRTLEGRVAAVESESARQSAEPSRLDEQIARLWAGFGLPRPGAQELAVPDAANRPSAFGSGEEPPCSTIARSARGKSRCQIWERTGQRTCVMWTGISPITGSR